jgi:hypothetical protein
MCSYSPSRAPCRLVLSGPPMPPSLQDFPCRQGAILFASFAIQSNFLQYTVSLEITTAQPKQNTARSTYPSTRIRAPPLPPHPPVINLPQPHLSPRIFSEPQHLPPHNFATPFPAPTYPKTYLLLLQNRSQYTFLSPAPTITPPHLVLTVCPARPTEYTYEY